MSANAGSAPMRRNGRQQACEPCRLRKVSCDHRLPVCSRCKRGSISDKCIYVPQSRKPSTPSSAKRLSSPRRSRPSPSPSPVPLPRSGGDSVGYLGPTSFSAFFQDTCDNLPSVQIATPLTEDDVSLDTDATRALDKVTLEKAICVLRSIPDEPTSHSLFGYYNNACSCSGGCRLAILRLLDTLWESFGSYLEGDRDYESLARMGRRLCYNSTIPFEENQTDPDDWLRCFSGPNLRWESLGMLFTYWASGSRRGDHVPKDRDLSKPDRRKLMLKYKNCANRCAELSRGCPQGNTVLLSLLYKNSLLDSQVYGDASMENWRSHGECVAMTTFMGLHALPDRGETDWSVTVQIKRRAFASVFNIDKVIATFAGRPPLLSRRFSSTPLPLDLSDEVLLIPDPTGITQRQHLDSNGWSLDGKIHSTTMLRARTMMAFIRDAILEIALQEHEADFSSADLLFHLRRREMEAVAQFPPAIIYKDSDINDQTLAANELYAKMLVRLEHLQNLFFIERLLAMGGSGSTKELLDISLEMVSLTLFFWTHQNRLGEAESDFEWLVMSYAAPAGGVMCMELLRSSRDGGSSSTARSTIVQQLSLLVGFLDWVEPTAPNGGLCSSVKKVIRHTLDEALNTSSSTSEIMEGIANWDVDFSTDFNEFFNFDLMDTFDWLRPEGIGHGDVI